MPKPYKSPLEKKLAYLLGLASVEGVDLASLKWSYIIPRIHFSISFNVLFNFMLNLYLSLSLHFHMPELDFEMPEFPKFFGILPEKIKYEEIEAIEKAQYGVTNYDYSYYDPKEARSVDLARCAWDLRYKTTERDTPAYKHTDKACGYWTEQYVSNLTSAGVRKEYAQAIVDAIAKAEGKILNSGYWDFAVFDVSKFVEEKKPTGPFKDVFKARSPEDWKTELELETLGVYECHWDWDRFDYARWGDTYEGMSIEVDPKLGEILQEKIEDFWKRTGIIEQHGQKVLYQRIFWWQRVQRMHEYGGKHQISLQYLKNDINRLLNQKGVPGMFKIPYLNFAQELYYMYYTPYRRYKQWRKVLTPDDLLAKYKNMGCDEEILKEIKGVVEKWQMK